MKETILKDRTKMIGSIKSQSLKFILTKMMYFILSFTLSRGYILGSYHPFALSFSASVPSENLTFTLIGSILGYFVPLKLGSGVRYISATLSIGAIRWALNDLTKIKSHVLYSPIIVFVSSFVTGIAVNCSDGINKHGLIITLLESFISSVVSYFFDRTFKVISSKKENSLNTKNFTYILLSISVVLLSFSSLSIHGISIGRILSITLILILSYSLGITGGTISGISTGFMLSLPSFGLAFLSGSYAFSGLMSGIFSHFGKFGVSMAFLLSYLTIFFRSADVFHIMTGLYELVIAIIIFFILPESLFKLIKYSFSDSCVEHNNINKLITKRIKTVSNSLSSVKGCVDKTIAEIRNFSPNNCNEACMDAVKSYCSNCGIKKFCWNQNYISTYNEVQNIIQNPTNILSSKLSYCRNLRSIEKRIGNIKKDFSKREFLNSQTKELKTTITNHFSEISSILNEIANEIELEKSFDWILSSKIKNMLTSMEINDIAVCCTRDANNRIFLDIESNVTNNEKFDNKIFGKISSIIGKKLDKPIINTMDNKISIQLSEKKEYKVSFSVSQHVCNGGKVCGDSCRCFQDNTGKFNIILSDGMGTGSSAAVSGILVSELVKKFLKTGISIDTVVKLVNSAILLNTNEESLTALDVLSIDLFTGKSKLIKAGSPATYIVRENKVKKLEFSSLPLGILNEVSFSCENLDLKPGDWIILLSDGVTDIGEEWIMNLLSNIDYTTASEVSKYVTDRSIKARMSTHDDDITAVVLNIYR